MDALRLGSLIGHGRQADLLRRALQAGRLPPALLFHGPPGCGRLRAALSLGAALNCAAPIDGDACGSCVSCRKVAGQNHPDVRICESEASARSAGRALHYPAARPAGDEAGEGGGRSTTRAGTRLLAAQVRRLLRDLEFRPFEGGQRLIAIDDLETDPTQGCANILLKTLEEPPADTVLVVLASLPESLPATVRSRCLALGFLPTPVPRLAAELETRGLPPAEALRRAALSGGRPGAAFVLDLAEESARRDAVLAALGRSVQEGPLAALQAADGLGRSREEFPRLLTHIMTLARDLMSLPWLRPPAALLHADVADEIARLSSSCPPARAARLLDLAAWCERAAERFVDPLLMLENLFLVAGGHLPADALRAPWIESDSR